MARLPLSRSSGVKVVEGGNELSRPLRRTGRPHKPKAMTDGIATMDNHAECTEDDVRPSDRSPSPPAKKPRARGTTKSTTSLNDDQDPDNKAPSAKKRRGGNKRKHDHEYCLTCAHYGRACGGRREGQEGCAVCRDPNREKGEKLRECLWADPENGITDYRIASAMLKAAKAAERAAKRKPVAKRKIARAKGTRDMPHAYSYASAPPNAYYSASLPPPVRCQLDVLPPSRNNAGASVSRAFVESPDSLLSSIGAPTSSHLTAGDLPNGTSKLSRQCFSQPPQLFPLPEEFAPFYDARINAYVLPAYPHSNYLPPSGHRAHAQQFYISPYDVPARQTIFPHPPPPPVADIEAPRLVNSTCQPRDATSTPSLRWSKSESKITTVGGYDFKAKSWKSEPSSAISDRGLPAGRELADIVPNFVPSERNGSIVSSPLSCAVDISGNTLECVGGEKEQVAAYGHPDEVTVENDKDDEVDAKSNDGGRLKRDRSQVMMNSIFKKQKRRKRAVEASVRHGCGEGLGGGPDNEKDTIEVAVP